MDSATRSRPCRQLYIAESARSAESATRSRPCRHIYFAESARSAESPPQGRRSPQGPLLCIGGIRKVRGVREIPRRTDRGRVPWRKTDLRQSNGQTSKQRPPSLVICQSEPMSPQGRACCHPRASATQPCQLPVKANVSAGKTCCQGKCRPDVSVAGCRKALGYGRTQVRFAVSAPSVYKHCGWPGQNGLGLAVSLQPDLCAACIAHAEHLVEHLSTCPAHIGLLNAK